MTLTERMNSWIEASRAWEEKARQRRLDRTPTQKRRDKAFKAVFLLAYGSLALWMIGGLKGATFVLKVLFVALHVAAFMDVELTESDRWRAVDGMLSALDDNSGSLSRQVAKSFSKAPAKPSVATGMLLANDNGPTVAAIQEGGPAEEAGLKVGDRVVSISGQDVSDNYEAARQLSEVIDTFADEGIAVPVEVLREGKSITLDMKMKNWLPKLAYDMGVQDGVVHIVLTRFRPGAADDVAAIIEERLASDHIDHVIIDLRGNPGGLVEEVKELASLFMPKGTTVSLATGRRSILDMSETDREERFPQIKRVGVIMDKDSASASEGFAAFVRDHDLGSIAGETSYGKGSRQVYIDEFGLLPFRMTVARFTGPAGTEIDGVGIEPDLALDEATPDWADLVDQLRHEISR